MRQREGYYAALERQRVGEAMLKDRINQRDREQDGQELDALELLYTEVGMKAFAAFNSCLEWLSHLGAHRTGAAEPDRSLGEAVSQGFERILEELGAVKERVARIESSIAALEAGMRRIDKYTMEAFRNLQEMEERLEEKVHRREAADPQGYRGRMAKEDAASLALEAARRMREEGKRLTLASVAREAGLKYGQIVYAFGNKEGFFKALSENQRRDAGEPARSGYKEESA